MERALILIAHHSPLALSLDVNFTHSHILSNRFKIIFHFQSLGEIHKTFEYGNLIYFILYYYIVDVRVIHSQLFTKLTKLKTQEVAGTAYLIKISNIFMWAGTSFNILVLPVWQIC